jgi:hypothetical protein
MFCYHRFFVASFRANKTAGFVPSRNLPFIFREILRLRETFRFRTAQDDAFMKNKVAF